MSTAATSPAGFPLWGARRGSWFLVAIHVPFVATPPALTIAAVGPSPAQVGIIMAVSLAIGGLQLRHSIATARGSRPAGWRWTLAVLAMLAYLPLWWWFSWGNPFGEWSMQQLFVAASAAMLLRGPTARLVVVGAVVVPVIGSAAWLWITTEPGAVWVVVSAVYQLAVFAVFPATLYWSARLVRTVDELFAARTALAESAVEGERRRISRDLHDLLGYSLSAVSLKGDLALRLLPADRNAALAEIEDLTGVARDALRDVRTVALAEHDVSLHTEVDGAAALLDAAGLDVRISVELPEPPPAAERLLAWAVREGATNILRHSQARTCWVTATSGDATVRLEIVNDGAREPAEPGRGLAGLAERARTLSGSVSAERIRGGRFRLRVEVPMNPPDGPSTPEGLRRDTERRGRVVSTRAAGHRGP